MSEAGLMRIASLGMAAAVLLTAPASAQSREVLRKVDPRVITQPLRKAEPRPATRDVALIDLPANLVRVDREAGWTVERQPKARPGAIPAGAGAAIYVTRMGWARNGFCGGARTDYVGLSRIRENGFVPVEIRFEEIPPPFASAHGGRSYVNGTIDSERTRERIAGWSTLEVRAVMHVSKQVHPRIPRQCWSGYRLHITMRGPANRDPLTGRTVTPSRVN